MRIQTTGTVDGANTGQAINLNQDSLRCDYRSPGTNAYYGCVFHKVVPTHQVSKALRPQYAQHIADAQATNWPEGKPGDVPLTRLTDPSDIAENRTESCRDEPNPRPLGLECDEYPFASTYDGTYTSGKDASHRLIDATQNRDGGTALQVWYGEQRILDSDEFWVQVTA
ncbi:NucA/NucB deoxyribonuclease domain-containing protein [Nonomuraea sp. NPDC050536]|uniref:NucA/NucB deoxyribonuclease domain-containing protein n=1 Tax=Nonomuraea sp. NPDC050536 TaxID=3364366 RepID=UPI0037C631B4